MMIAHGSIKQSPASSLNQLETREILDSIPLSIAILDKDLRITGMNRFLEALCGHSALEAHGIHADNIIRSNISAKEQLFKKTLESGDAIVIEGDIINQGRKKVPIRFTLSPLHGTSLESTGMLVVLEDLSLLREFDQKVLGCDGALSELLGHSPKMQAIFELLPVLAHTDATVLVTGETGTGKDLLAEAIHKASKRANYPFIKVNCGALPETLLESELFGHVRGAFTGAHSDKQGFFRLAQGGTIFLTEIGDLPLALQVKLLTVLDDREFFPVGASKKVKVDVRLITGTHRNLRQLVKEGKFREDLFFRLNVLQAHLPPLHERDGDVRLLIDHFLTLCSANLGKKINGLTSQALALLNAYSYPGNVRELRNIIEYGVNICQQGKIDIEDLPSYLQGEPPTMTPTETKTIATEAQEPAEPPAQIESTKGMADYSSWKKIEATRILDALRKTGGNRTKAAKELSLSRSTLWRKIKQYELE